jgi:hypothetical protein
MEKMMDQWISQSNPSKQITVSALSCVAGMFLIIAFRDFEVANTNTFAGFLLGVLLFVVGAAGNLMSGKQTVVVDPQSRLITIEDTNRFGTKERSIPFSDIEDVTIGFLGKWANFISSYYLRLTLRDGRKYSLFAPGRFYDGSSDRDTAERWKRRLEMYLAQ